MSDEVADVLPTSPRTELDDVINHIAAEATSGEPSPGFHARVMARIDVRRSPHMTWTLAATTAAAVIVAVVIVRPWQRPPAPLQATVAATRPGAGPVAASPASSTSPVATPVVESRTRVVANTPVFAPQVPALPPIDPIEPITRDSIQPTRLSIPQLTLEPIVMPAVNDDGSNRERR